MISKKCTRRFCSEPIENIENYQDAVNDSEHMWDCHHRNEICLANQSRLDGGITPRKQLIADGMYYHRPACELIFLRRDVHSRLHNINNKHCCGYHHSDESRRKMSESHKGRHHSEETKRKIGEKSRGRSHSDETKRKIAESRIRWFAEKKRNGGTI